MEAESVKTAASEAIVAEQTAAAGNAAERAESQTTAAGNTTETEENRAAAAGNITGTEESRAAAAGNAAETEESPEPSRQTEQMDSHAAGDAASPAPELILAAGESVLEPEQTLAAGTVLSSEQLDFNDLSQYFTAVPIERDDAVYRRINGRSWQENSHIALSDLRYLKLLHYNFSGQIQVGEMIVNKDIADDVIRIFEELFACGYQIQSMYLIDDYWTGDPDDSDTASIDANNTSAFCYRPVTNGRKLSNHAYGKAIDLNPQQNPYVSYSSGSPKWYHENANDYIARDTGLPHVITHEDTAFLIFQKYGFTWGGDWNNPKDYQHFERK